MARRSNFRVSSAQIEPDNQLRRFGAVIPSIAGQAHFQTDY
jgi:hypothetical protein